MWTAQRANADDDGRLLTRTEINGNKLTVRVVHVRANVNIDYGAVDERC